VQTSKQIVPLGMFLVPRTTLVLKEVWPDSKTLLSKHRELIQNMISVN
jgi:hypothetical protein